MEANFDYLCGKKTKQPIKGIICGWSIDHNKYESRRIHIIDSEGKIWNYGLRELILGID